MSVATGCGCKEVYRFPHTTYPYSSCICTFLQQHPHFLFIFLNVFRSCSSTFLNYILCITLRSLFLAGTYFSDFSELPHFR